MEIFPAHVEKALYPFQKHPSSSSSSSPHSSKRTAAGNLHAVMKDPFLDVLSELLTYVDRQQETESDGSSDDFLLSAELCEDEESGGALVDPATSAQQSSSNRSSKVVSEAIHIASILNHLKLQLS